MASRLLLSFMFLVFVLSSALGPERLVAASSAPRYRPNLIYQEQSLMSPGQPPYTAGEIRRAYDFGPLYANGINGSSTVIAIIDAFGSPSLATDLASYDSLMGLPRGILNIYYPDGSPKQLDSGWAVETTLDTEWAHAIAPGAAIDLVVAFDDSLGSVYDAIAYVASSLPGSTSLTMSFGMAESQFPSSGSFTIAGHHQLMEQITSHGTTIFASSGDSGASSCCNVQYPASDPLVVAVGGTSLQINPDGSYNSETAWAGSSAGSSVVFPKPAWQNVTGSTMRAIVDVSYDADPNTGVFVQYNGQGLEVGGTSAGSPQWAALLALASQANSMRYGALNQRLYSTSPFRDITLGSDGFFSAATGWDYPTGLGTPDADSTVHKLGSPQVVRLNDTKTLQGVTVNTTGWLVVDPVGSTFSGTMAVLATNSSNNSILYNRSYSIPNLALHIQGGRVRASFLLNIAIQPYPLSSDITVTLTGGIAATSVSLTRQIDIREGGYVDVIDAGFVYGRFGSLTGSAKYDPRGDLDASGTIDIIDAGLAVFYFGCPNFV